MKGHKVFAGICERRSEYVIEISKKSNCIVFIHCLQSNKMFVSMCKQLVRKKFYDRIKLTIFNLQGGWKRWKKEREEI